MTPNRIHEWIDKLIKKEIDSREIIEAEIVEVCEFKLLTAPKRIDIYV
jgi:hypothetical protein